MTSILITGGTGAFGMAFAQRLIEQSTVDRICIYSRDEHKQATMRVALNDDPRLRFFIGDVRDLPRLTHAMDDIGVVIHAAALKRVEVGEYNPLEMVKTNVLGAMNVIEAASAARAPLEQQRLSGPAGGLIRHVPGIRRVVALSTDKACAPINTYGASKLLAEKLFLAANNTVRREEGPIFAVTRYGNVAGSTGSVIPMWRDLVNRAGAASLTTVPVTDPECTRYWMRIVDAVDLVMHTVENMTGGERNIPILPAYRLADLAEAMGVKMKVVGMRPGEKLHERMVENASSDEARRMSVEELREELLHV